MHTFKAIESVGRIPARILPVGKHGAKFEGAWLAHSPLVRVVAARRAPGHVRLHDEINQDVLVAWGWQATPNRLTRGGIWFNRNEHLRAVHVPAWWLLSNHRAHLHFVQHSALPELKPGDEIENLTLLCGCVYQSKEIEPFGTVCSYQFSDSGEPDWPNSRECKTAVPLTFSIRRNGEVIAEYNFFAEEA